MPNLTERENYLEVAQRAAGLAAMFRDHAAERTCAPHQRCYAETMADHYEAIAHVNLEMAKTIARKTLSACH